MMNSIPKANTSIRLARRLSVLSALSLMLVSGGCGNPATTPASGDAWSQPDQGNVADAGATADSTATGQDDDAQGDTTNADATNGDSASVDSSGCAQGCDDGDGCTVDSCVADTCKHTAAADATSCDDGDKCTEKDSCLAGVCKAGPKKDCSTTSQCATGSCNPAQGCTTVEKSGQCDDGSKCTKDDVCGFGVCEGTYIGCDDGNSCTDDSCEAATGCTHSNMVDDSPCAPKKVCNVGVCVSAGTLYAHSSSTLYKLELKSKAFSIVGKFTFNKSGGSVTDIALDRGSTLYAVTFSNLFVCKSDTAKCTWLMQLPTSFNGLTFVHKGTIYPNHDALIGIANDGGWWHVDYQQNKLKKLGSYGSGYTSSGDAFSVLGVGTFATVKKSGKAGDHLVRVNPKTGKVLQDYGAISASNLWGFAWADGVFYGFGSNGQVWDVNVKTGKGKPLTGFSIPKVSWWGAGVSTEAGP